MQESVTHLLPTRRGHFRLESGHHGDLWLDLERLCVRPEPVQRLAAEIAARLESHDVQVVCGPLVEGAFVALMVASSLGVPFTYSEPYRDPQADALFPVRYRLPQVLRAEVRGKRVAIVNDVVNAGSAVRGTFADLETWGALPVAIGVLAVLGKEAARFAAEKRVALEALSSLPNELWTPSECPLCRRGVALTETGTSPV
jgi:orotate phosphoribosyltransferase